MVFVLLFFYLIYILVAKFIYKLTKRFTQKKWIRHTVLATLILIPTYDIIITNIVGAIYSIYPKPYYINKKVEYPMSIYWEDNIYPGFNKEDRELMIESYLDGVHLKTMALNGDDGKIYTYEANATTWDRLKAFKDDTDDPYHNMTKTIVQDIVRTTQKVYTKETMPKMNYTVKSDEVLLDPISRYFIYVDKVEIIDNKNNESIAYSRRVRPFDYNAIPDMILGNRYFHNWGWEIFPTKYNEDLDIPTFNTYKWIGYYSGKHYIDINVRLYNKYIKGEK
ncbi:putative membrane protein [Campylobacter blaseri]|uniref:Uncharacterized protein n=1 Tax=Campylobacter blaseri TaxID=2042961 RepID=A0A2P8QYB6_9BACT|nr:hypothetical protein [Campylobacter blaseri]PSM51234.1 hypothetical protein CQ405_08945 [Campylobacter blaseri]PSM52378.1 hypothetical protein CRN67_08950 [Campylobacter blaseri]QKF86610.1 putative membrane protein [Campylobacter blaseri]